MKSRYGSATIQNWRDALAKVADISGFDLDGAFNGDEGHMLEKIVERVVKMSKKPRLYVAKHPTGLNEKVTDFETTILKQQHRSGNVHIVGIVGLGGVGKTTLSLELFNRKRSNYSKSYFLSDVREKANKSSLHSLQSELLKGLTELDLHINNINEGIGMLERHLKSSHVFFILDDIDHEDQLEAFLPVKDVLSWGSLILITSRDRDVLARSGVEQLSIHKLTGLPKQHSRELFCSYAFYQPYPVEGFEDLVDKFLEVCDGLPLSLKVLGALLYGNSDKSFWENILYQVKVPTDIQKRLKISYDALRGEEQQIFLDIACFLIGEKKSSAITLWDGSGWNGSLGFKNLEGKCLVEVDPENVIHMHDHLRDMGRDIAEEKLPGRLWRPIDNIDNWLHQQSSAITDARGISIPHKDSSDKSIMTHSSMLSWYQTKIEKVFGNRMMNLLYTLDRFLGIRNRVIELQYACYRFLGVGVGVGAMKLHLLSTEGYLLECILRRVYSPNLIWLSWSDCPYSYLPSWIPMTNLRVLRVQGRLLETLWQDKSQGFVWLGALIIITSLNKMATLQEDLTYKVIKDSNGRNIFCCLASECNGLRRSKCCTFNKHREKVHSWEAIKLHVGAPRGHNYKLRSATKLEKDRKRKNYDIEYRFKKNRKVVETAAIQKEIKKTGVKCVQELSADALERVRIIVSEYDAHSKEKKNALKKVVRKKIIQNKDWSMLRSIFNESPPRNVCNSSQSPEDNIMSVEETLSIDIVPVGDSSSSNLNECIEQGEGTSQTPDVGEDVDVVQCSLDKSSRSIFDGTPDSVPLGPPIFDRTPDSVPLGPPIFDRTPDSVPLGSPIFDRTPDSVPLGMPMSKNVQKTPKENVQNVLNEEGDRDGKNNTVVNHGKVQNANTQRRGRKRTFLTPNKTKDKKSKYHHPSFYSQSIAKTKRPRTCTMKINR